MLKNYFWHWVLNILLFNVTLCCALLMLCFSHLNASFCQCQCFGVDPPSIQCRALALMDVTWRGPALVLAVRVRVYFKVLQYFPTTSGIFHRHTIHLGSSCKRGQVWYQEYRGKVMSMTGADTVNAWRLGLDILQSQGRDELKILRSSSNFLP